MITKKREKGNKKKRLSKGFRKHLRNRKSEIRKKIIDPKKREEELEKLERMKEEILNRFKNSQNFKKSVVV